MGPARPPPRRDAGRRRPPAPRASRSSRSRARSPWRRSSASRSRTPRVVPVSVGFLVVFVVVGGSRAPRRLVGRARVRGPRGRLDPRAVSGTTRRPGALKLIGHSRLALHRAFHHLVLEVRDDGGFLANNCKLARVTRRSHHPNADADFRSVRVRARKPQPTTDPDPPALVATFGPFDRDVILIPECDRRGAAASISSISSSSANPVAYRVSLRSSGAADGGRRARLLLGIALVALAPALSEWAAAYYGAGMVLSVTVLALVLIRRAARLAPGGRSARGVASVVAAAAAFAVPSEHLARFLEAYVALCLRPIKLVVRAIVERNADEAGLPVALAATAATLAGGRRRRVLGRAAVDDRSGHGRRRTDRRSVRARRHARRGGGAVALLHAGRAVRDGPRGGGRGVVRGGVVPSVEATRGDASKATRRETKKTRRFGF